MSANPAFTCRCHWSWRTLSVLGCRGASTKICSEAAVDDDRYLARRPTEAWRSIFDISTWPRPTFLSLCESLIELIESNPSAKNDISREMADGAQPTTSATP